MIIKFIKEFRKFKEDTKKQHKELDVTSNKYLSDAQENANMKLKKMITIYLGFRNGIQ